MFCLPCVGSSRSTLVAGVVSETCKAAIPAAHRKAALEWCLIPARCPEGNMQAPSQTLAAFESCLLQARGWASSAFRLRLALPAAHHPTGRWCSVLAPRQHGRFHAFRPLRCCLVVIPVANFIPRARLMETELARRTWRRCRKP
jgi:hypothetical protein